MFVYEKKLQYPVNIKTPNPKLAKIIITQYGGADTKMLYFKITKNLKIFLKKFQKGVDKPPNE
jgi:spore coat protein JC